MTEIHTNITFPYSLHGEAVNLTLELSAENQTFRCGFIVESIYVKEHDLYLDVDTYGEDVYLAALTYKKQQQLDELEHHMT